MRGELHYDAVVIGAGTAGLVAGARLAEGGARVCVLAKGVGSTHLAPGTIDVLGYQPDRVVSPRGTIAEFALRHPEHPYAALGPDAVAEAVRWLQSRVESGPLPGYRYLGDLDRNYLLPTAVGALRPSAVIPETMVAGDSVDLDRVCVVGTRMLRDFHSSLCAANLSRLGLPARSVEAEIEAERADLRRVAHRDVRRRVVPGGGRGGGLIGRQPAGAELRSVSRQPGDELRQGGDHRHVRLRARLALACGKHGEGDHGGSVTHQTLRK